MSLRHPTTANVVQFCDGAQLHVYTGLVFNPMQGALKYPHLSSEALMLTLSFLKTAFKAHKLNESLKQLD